MKKRTQKGQTVILGALTALLVSVCLFMTISIAWQVRSRIQLQHAADARAFSDATLVARIYNVFAYSNRAMVGNVVAMTILHAYHSEVSAAADLYFATIPVYATAVGLEIDRSKVCFPFIRCIPCINFIHCVHAGKLVVDMAKAVVAWLGDTMGKRIRDTDPSFVDAIKAIDGSNKAISALQLALKGTLAAIGAPGDFAGGDSQMNEWNMLSGKSSSASCSLALLIASSIANSVPACKINLELQEEDKKEEITEIINASRPFWIRNRMRLTVAPVMMLPATIKPLQEKLNYWKFGVIAQVALTGGATAFYQDTPSQFLPTIGSALGGSSKSGQKGEAIASYDHYRLLMGAVDAGCFWLLPSGKATPLLGPLAPARLVSDDNGGEHNSWGFADIINKVHDKEHELKTKNVFNMMVYEADSSQDDGYRQPSIVSSFSTKSLSISPEKEDSSVQNPWDLKFKIRLDLNEASVDLKNQKSAKAVSKALTYYHHPGNWKEPPNFWSPFWRAKLHPLGLNLTDAADAATVGAAEALAGTDLGSIDL